MIAYPVANIHPWKPARTRQLSGPPLQGASRSLGQKGGFPGGTVAAIGTLIVFVAVVFYFSERKADL